MKNLFSRFARDESGATAIEYGLIAALLSVACIAALTAMSGQISATFGSITSTMKAA